MLNNGTNLEFHKLIEGIDVFCVGKQQLWDWCGWSSRGLDCGGYGAAMLCNADSLRKGSYVVVESHARRGHVGKCTVADSFGSLRAAVFAVKDYLNADARMFAKARTGWVYAHDYEIWRVVDDGELWQAWERDAALSRVDVPNELDSYDNGFMIQELYQAFVPSLGRLVPFVRFTFADGTFCECMSADMGFVQVANLLDCGHCMWLMDCDLGADNGYLSIGEIWDMLYVRDLFLKLLDAQAS